MNRLSNAGDNLAKLRDEAEEALRNFKGTQVSWVPRNWNKEADALVNKAFGPKTTEIIRSQEVPEPVVRRRKSRKASWRELPAAEMAAHLLETPTIGDRVWTDEARLPKESRSAFIRRVLLGETSE